MPVSQAGALNLSALNVPDIYVQIQEPSVQTLNGLPTDIAGIVGTASWGPVNKPVTVSSAADYYKKFGPILDTPHDAGTAVAIASQQGASNFRVVRVTDGSDVKASAEVGDGVLTFTALYSGTTGNYISITETEGSAVGSRKLTIALPGFLPEVFDNIQAVGGLWADALAQAINAGTGPLRGPSQLVGAAPGPGEAPGFSVESVTLGGGTDGNPTSDSAFVGSDVGSRTGMYALRGTYASLAMLAGVTSPSTWTTQAAFGETEGVYMITAGAAGQYSNISEAITAKQTAGLDSAWVKVMLGDWIFWQDPVTGTIRIISPQAFVLGRLANLSPENSSLNKKLYSIVGTERTMAGTPYSTAELSQLAGAGIDVITNPVPGGNYFGVRIGHNSSSNALTWGDNYTRMTNYIAFTMNGGMGRYVGQTQTPSVRQQAKGTLTSFLSNMETSGMIGNVNGGPAFSVQLDASNNPDNRVALGYMQADVRVTYLSVIEKFLINLEGSQSTVVRVSTTNNQ